MPELFIELFSEEIPARMQRPGAEALARLLAEALAALTPADARIFHGPRRIACALAVAGAVAPSTTSTRGPRTSAPDRALDGFLRKHGAAREAVRAEGDFWVLDQHQPGIAAGALIAQALPPLLWRFAWPKAMRWGGASRFTWVRPLRRITCLLDGNVVPFALAEGDDDAHGLAAGCETEGHRFLAPAPFAVSGAADWQAKLAAAHVLVAADDRRARIEAGLEACARAAGAAIVPDAALLDEVAGLVETPFVMLGRIAPAHMDLPPEVMQVSMRVNQRYFALADAAGRAAPYFAFVAGVPGSDGGAAIVAGNERVLRARFDDARHFWDLDRKTRLEARLPALDAVTFHARLGSQGERARRIGRLAADLARRIGAEPAAAERAGLLAKADLTTGMVGEFPELQGVMGGYYAVHDGEAPEIAAAIRQHYQPRGASDAAPEGAIACAVALADKLDQLAGFFAVGEKPSGSGDPFALRRAALGVIRILRERGLRVALAGILAAATKWEAGSPLAAHAGPCAAATAAAEVLAFIHDRLRVQLRAEGARHDVLNAVLGAGADDDLVRLLARTDAVAAFIATEDGLNLLAASKRAANILRIESRNDGPHEAAPDARLLEQPEERALADALAALRDPALAALAREDFDGAMTALAGLRAPLDAFFAEVTVNAERPELRRNRLALLNRLSALMNQVADFSKIEG